MPVPLLDLAIMPRGYPLASGTVCPFAQDTFLEKRIAHHTRIRGTTAHVFIDKVLHDDFPELFTHIGYMVLDTEAGSYGLKKNVKGYPRCAWSRLPLHILVLAT